MGRIQSSVGLITGVAIEDTVDKLMQLNAIPRDRIVSRSAELQKQQVALTELTALVVGVQLSSDRLGQASLYASTKVSSSKTDVLTARSTGTPQPGNYSFIPVQQAQSQQLTSSLFSSSEQAVGTGELVIHTGGFLDGSVNLDQLNAGAGVARGKIRITDRSGAQQTIDLRFAQSANDVVATINANDSLGVVASLQDDRFVLTDITGSTTSPLKVEDIGGGTTATDLGLGGISLEATTATGGSVQSLSNNTAITSLLDGRGLDLRSSGDVLRFQLSDGSTINFATSLDSNSASLGQLIDEINEAGGDKLVVSLSPNGKSLQVEDLTTGAGSLVVTSPLGSLAQQLGLDNPAVDNKISGDRLIAGLSDVLLSSLAGGHGWEALGEITVTDRSGASASVDLADAETLADVLNSINASGVGVDARLNRTKTGIEIVDTTGLSSGNLIVANADSSETASLLNIEGSLAVGAIDSGSLNRQFVGRNTALKDFNHGKTFPLGSIRITDSAGKESAVNLATKGAKTVGDVIDAINGLGLGIEARVNDAGDGLLIVDTAAGEGSLSIQDIGSSSSAKLLAIAGQGGAIEAGGTAAIGINGSRTIRLTTNDVTTVASLVEQLNGLNNSPISASTLNLSSSGGVRLLLSGITTGAHSRVAVQSDLGISFSETSQGRDAVIAFGANETSGGVLLSSATNTFTDVVEQVEFTITGTSESPVTVSITESSESLSKQLETFVSQYNKLHDKLASLTNFDATTNSVGLLFGSNAALRVDQSYGRLLSGAIRGAGTISSLGQVGVQLTETGKLEFDQSKFEATLDADPAAVKEFFTNEESGFAAKAKVVADRLAGVDGGVLLTRSNSLQTQIEQNTSRVEAFNIRLDKQRTRLLTQFYNMEQAIAKLQTNLTALNQMQIIPPMGSSN